MGPGHYDLKNAEALLLKKSIITFTKDSRALDPILRKTDSPGPTSYDTLPEPYFLLGTDNSRNLKSTSQFLKQPKIKGGTFGTRDRTLDLTRFNG